jgi:hypothetical protein
MVGRSCCSASVGARLCPAPSGISRSTFAKTRRKIFSTASAPPPAATGPADTVALRPKAPSGAKSLQLPTPPNSPAPSRRHIPLLTELEFFSIADSTKVSPRWGWRVLDCGGKRSATPLSHPRDGLIVQSSSPARKRRRRSRFAGALHDAPVSSTHPKRDSNPSAQRLPRKPRGHPGKPSPQIYQC